MTQKSSASISPADKDAIITRLLAQVAELTARLKKLDAENAALRARVGELEEKLSQPPKTPDNSSTPPSQGRKASDETASKAKQKAHPGAHRTLHPNPTAKLDLKAGNCQHCGCHVGGLPQFACEIYDHIEIPPIEPEVTRVTLHGGVCPCCAKKFKAAPPNDMKPGSPSDPIFALW